MGASLRELRQRRKSVTATKKITRAMELIASSRVLKAQQAAARTLPYTRELNRAVSAVATYSRTDHPLTRPQADKPRRVAVVFITSDRGMNGAYSSNVIKMVSQMRERLDAEGIEMVRYAVSRKGIGYLSYRGMDIAASWSGFSDSPTYDRAVDIADRLVEDFLRPYEEGGVDEIWTIYTRMESMLSQTPRARRVLPLEVVEGVHEVSSEDLLRRWVIHTLMGRFELRWSVLKERFGVSGPEHFADALEELKLEEPFGTVEVREDGVFITPLGRRFVRNLVQPFDAYLKKLAPSTPFSRTVSMDVPPWAAMIRSTIARPRPAPSLLAWSARRWRCTRSRTLPSASPGPSARPPNRAWGPARTWIVPPAGVTRAAFSIRLRSAAAIASRLPFTTAA